MFTVDVGIYIVIQTSIVSELLKCTYVRNE